MKPLSVFVLGLLVAHAVGAQKSYDGAWQGKLQVSGTSLRLVIHLKSNGDAYTATMESPDQGAKGIPASSVTVTGDSLLLNVAAVGGKLTGRFTSDTTFSGQWLQGLSLPLELKKLTNGEALAAPKRPQTPKPPFPYRSEDLVYFNRNKSIQYGATLTAPQGAGPFPAFVLITGSGQQNRDEELFGHRPFAVLADYLTRKGYAVLRVDDRGVGQTTGGVATATSKDFAGDVMAAMDYLKTLPHVNRNKIGLLGHSEGGMIAQLVAAERGDVAFIVSLAGPGQKTIDLMAEQNRALLQKNGLSAGTVNHYVPLYKSLVLALANAPTDSAARMIAAPLLDQWLTTTPKAVADSLGITNANKEDYLRNLARAVRSPWFRYFINYDPAPALQKVRAKVLALNGDQDIQVASAPNLAGLKASLQKGGNKNVEVKELKGLNHLFQRCQKCTVAEYAELEETFAPEALEVIGAWLEKNVKQ